jgi:flagellar biosynthesis component FlhA
MEHTLATMEGDRRAQERYTKQIEKELKEQYTPIIKKMSFSQGKVLIKLIDRQTGQTSYDLVREMRGNFSAFFWQNLGRIFGMNLKAQYDAEGEDQLIEQIIRYHEAGVL